MVGLFRRDVTVAVLASGSGGNCTYVGDGSVGVLVDCGISTRRIQKRMESLGLKDAPIDGVLITHEHGDHVGSARVLYKRLLKDRGQKVPFYMTQGTLEGTPERSRPEGVEILTAGEPFRIRHMQINPFSVPHDVLDPVAYRVEVGGIAAAVVTDLGRPTKLVSQHMQDLDVLVLEYNHDLQQLMDGDYPWHLKQRIKGNHGHLSNRQANQLLRDSIGDKLKHLVLAHLSEQNNTPEKALRACNHALEWLKVDHVSVQAAPAHGPATPISLVSHVW